MRIGLRVLVTGGSGFLGRHTIPKLVDSGHLVYALARSVGAAELVGQLGAEPLMGDLDIPSTLPYDFASHGPDVLLNLASLGFGHASTIIEAAASAGIERAVYVSTTAVATSLNAPSKLVRLAAEESIQQSSACWTIVRPTMIYGAPGDRNIERLLWFLKKTPLVPIPGRGSGLQQPIHVDDLAQALVDIVASTNTDRRRFDLAGPEPLSFRRLIAEAKAAVGSRAVLQNVPLKPVMWATRGYEKLSSNPRLKVEQVLRLTEDKYFPIDDARQAWGYEPRSFSHGVAHEVELLWG